jgi:hypothetical protein
MLEADYDFYAGGDAKCTSEQRSDLYGRAEKQGYTIVRGYDEYESKAKKAEKMMLYQKNVAEELPTVLKMAAGMYGIDLEEIVLQNAGRDILAEITTILAEPVISIFSTIISFVLLYFISKLVITLLLALVDLIFSNGVFGALNKTLGGISGAIIAFAAAWALSVLIEFLYHINGTGLENPGFLYTFFNTYSPIELLLSF